MAEIGFLIASVPALVTLANFEGRYKLLARARPNDADRLLDEAQAEVDRKWQPPKDMSR